MTYGLALNVVQKQYLNKSKSSNIYYCYYFFVFAVNGDYKKNWFKNSVYTVEKEQNCGVVSKYINVCAIII